ncbi:MAG: ASKHA domain-containing protein [Candidatus Hermodarchaeota archaeon]
MESKELGILIDFEPISRRLYVSKEKSIYKLLNEINVPFRSICGGLGNCGKCKILVQKGNKYLNELTSNEENLISELEIQNGWRLACETKIKPPNGSFENQYETPQIRIFLPSQLLLEDFKILTSGIKKNITLQPTIQKIYIDVKNPSLEEPYADFERIENEIISKIKRLKKDKEIGIEFNILKDIPSLLRINENKITIVLWNNNIIACEAANTIESNYGVAFDIGTTTIVGYLINLKNGKIYAVDSKLNSQTAYGEDLITRLTYIKENKENLGKLNSLVISDLNEIISNLCRKANIIPSNLYEATVVGNSVMHHIFLGFDPVNIGLSPFIPVVQRDLNAKALDLGLKINKNGNVYAAPIIAGFVGADTIGVILSSQIFNERPLTLAIDIGTNGEIIIGNRNNLIVGSCAAGSALEGAHIDDGMRAAAGAIDTIKIDPTNLDVSYTTIKNKKPIGICGSGLVDGIAEMLKSKLIARSGRFNRNFIDHERFVKNDKKIKFIIVNKEETSINKEISISQSDIRQIQMAKAAFYSGMRIILNYLVKNQSIEQVFLAGAFGNYINASNAKFIGMIPDIKDNHIYQIGNAAGIGAQHFLLNKELRNKARNLLNKIKYVEIAVEKEFQKEYAEAMYFPHLNLDYFPDLTEYKDIPER